MIDDIDALNLSSKRPHVLARRDGDARLAHDVDDILSLSTFLHSVPKTATFLFITSANINRFSKFFQWQIPKKIV